MNKTKRWREVSHFWEHRRGKSEENHLNKIKWSGDNNDLNGNNKIKRFWYTRNRKIMKPKGRGNKERYKAIIGVDRNQ